MTGTVDNPPRHRRVRGSLLLSACADALGAPFEGARAVDRSALDQRLAAPTAALRWTDDTALTLALAGHLTRRGGTVDRDELAADLVREWSYEPWRGYGRGAALVFSRIADGVPWARAAGELFDGRGSLGNGAAMRVAPVGLLPGLGADAVADRARRSAAVTHAHRQAQDGAAVQAVAVAVAADSDPGRPLDPARFVTAVTGQARTPEFRAALERVGMLLAGDPTPADVAAELGNDVSAAGSVPTALLTFLRCPDDPVGAVRAAVSLGGDTDTIAAMTGAIVGARVGDGGLPPAWLAALEQADRIEAAATALAGLDVPGAA